MADTFDLSAIVYYARILERAGKIDEARRQLRIASSFDFGPAWTALALLQERTLSDQANLIELASLNYHAFLGGNIAGAFKAAGNFAKNLSTRTSPSSI